MDHSLEKELQIVKIMDSIDEEIQLNDGAAEVLNEIIPDVFGSLDIEKVFARLVAQSPKQDDMVTSELRKLYNTSVLRIAEERYDPTDFERG